MELHHTQYLTQSYTVNRIPKLLQKPIPSTNAKNYINQKHQQEQYELALVNNQVVIKIFLLVFPYNS